MDRSKLTFSAPTRRRKGASKMALSDPAYSYFGRAPYRDAGPDMVNVEGAGGVYSVLYGNRLSSANEEIVPSRDRGVANAREADRNQPLINAGINKRAANTVGASLRLQYLPNWPALGIDPEDKRAVAFVQAVENQFSLWAEDAYLLCDAQRHSQFGPLMLLSCREAFGTEGETMVIVRYDEDRMAKHNGKFATFVEVVNCDRLSTPADYVDGRGPKIVAGRELDEYGGAVAFHIRVEEPGMEGAKWARVVRQTDNGRPVGIHFFVRQRAGQQRAMPAIIRSLRSIKMLDKFDDSSLQAAVINAILSIYIESPDTSADVIARLNTSTPTGGTNTLAQLWDKRFSYYEENEFRADGVRIPVLPPGDKISMESTSRASIDSKEFRTAFIRQMAAELNLTYEQFSGDYSETTFSSARAALIDIWRMIMVDRALFTQSVPYPIFVALMEEIWARGDELGVDWPAEWPDFYDNVTAYTQCEFRGPGMGWVDPLKDAQAAKERQSQGLTSPTSEAALQGQSFTDNVDQIARDHAYARSKNVALPGMPEFADLQRAAKTDPAAELAGGAAAGADPGDQPRDGDGQFGGDGDQQNQDDKRREKTKRKRQEEE